MADGASCVTKDIYHNFLSTNANINHNAPVLSHNEAEALERSRAAQERREVERYMDGVEQRRLQLQLQLSHIKSVNMHEVNQLFHAAEEDARLAASRGNNKERPRQGGRGEAAEDTGG